MTETCLRVPLRSKPASITPAIGRGRGYTKDRHHPAALLRLPGSVLIEQHDEWEATERRYFSEASMLELATMNNPIEALNEAMTLPELAAA